MSQERGLCRRGSGRVAKPRSFLQQLLSWYGTDSCFPQITITIRALPDDELLEIFDFCLLVADWDGDESERDYRSSIIIGARWRICAKDGDITRITFPSYPVSWICNYPAPQRDPLGRCWVYDRPYLSTHGASAAVRCPPWRVRIISLLHWSTTIGCVKSSLWTFQVVQLEKFAAEIHEPFQALTRLHIVLPDAFMGGSAPRLRSLYLAGIPLPALSKLLLSATDLVYLGL